MGKLKEWRECPDIAEELLVGKFLAFKFPFDSKQGGIFRTYDVFQWAADRGFELGLWINLSGIDKELAVDVIESNNCKYIHIPVTQFKYVNKKKCIDIFMKSCDTFIHDHPSKIIGVHCTHGFNRTGYFLVTYLVERQIMECNKAVETFARVRPPGIYRRNLLSDLHRKYFLSAMYVNVALPGWAKEKKKKKKASDLKKIMNE